MENDREYKGNENRAHIGRTTLLDWPTPMTAMGGVARAPAPNDIPSDRGICSATPMNKDPHIGGRHSNENRTVAPGEKNRSAEPGRRIDSRTTKYRY
jgi:hypothetical protein